MYPWCFSFAYSMSSLMACRCGAIIFSWSWYTIGILFWGCTDIFWTIKYWHGIVSILLSRVFLIEAVASPIFLTGVLHISTGDGFRRVYYHNRIRAASVDFWHSISVTQFPMSLLLSSIRPKVGWFPRVDTPAVRISSYGSTERDMLCGFQLLLSYYGPWR